jgi:hypothetical protein
MRKNLAEELGLPAKSTEIARSSETENRKNIDE